MHSHPSQRSHPAQRSLVARLSRATFGVAASVLLVVALVITADAQTGPDAPRDGSAITHAADAAATDSVRFRGQFRAAEKPLAAVGQWAYANANGSVARRNYSTSTQSRTQNGGACAYGGSGASCTGSAARSDATTDERPPNWDTSWGTLAPAAYVEFLADFSAGARCTADGGLTAVPGTGRFRYGNDSHLNGNGFAEYNLTSRGNNSTFNHNFQVAPPRSFTRPASSETWINISAVRRWGTVTAERRAWSEINVNWTATQSNTPRTGSVTYRAECGLQMNDGSGSTAGTNNVPMAQQFDVEHRETVTIEQDGEVSVVEIDPETGEPVDEASETDMAPEASGEPGASAPAPSTTTTRRPTTSAPRTSATTSPQTTTSSPAAEPVGSPRVGGFTVETQLEQESQAYQLLATRELTAAELRTVRDALTEAADGGASSGTVNGASWTRFSGDGRQRPVPVVEIELSGGAVVQLRPIIDGVELPGPDAPGEATSTTTATAATTTTNTQEAGR